MTIDAERKTRRSNEVLIGAFIGDFLGLWCWFAVSSLFLFRVYSARPVAQAYPFGLLR